VALSATVSNAEEFGQWLATLRGETEVVVEEHRPVPLWQHVMAGEHLYASPHADTAPRLPDATPDIGAVSPLGEAMRAPERAMLLQALEACGWNRTLAARRLGINRSTLYRKLRDLGLDAHRDAC